MSKYGERSRHPLWFRKRLDILERDAHTCRLCGEREGALHVHHLRYERGVAPWDYPDTALLTLCEYCQYELQTTDYGALIVESLLAGGAHFKALAGIVAVLHSEFTDSPLAGPIPRERWMEVDDALHSVLTAIKQGISAGQIRDALEALQPTT